jgi:uncharacterized membrane protein YhaH (DUF805 family)
MSSHELDTLMLYIHPPLAVVGYVFIFLFAAALLIARFRDKKLTGVFGLAAWVFTFLGLVTGMLWAQSSLGQLLVLGPQRNRNIGAVYFGFSLCGANV